LLFQKPELRTSDFVRATEKDRRMSRWFRELRYAIRVLWKNRTPTVVAFVTLALAIGATTAIFTVVDALLLRPLPFPGADRLVQIGRGYPDFLAPAVSVPKFMYWRSRAGYFDALQIPLRRGRLFDARDRRATLPVAIVNETAARRFWPGQDPIGQRITVGQPFVPELADTVAREIVGVVGDVREQGLGVDPPPVLYVPLSQQNDALTQLGARLLPFSAIIRGEGNLAMLTRSAQQPIWSVDPAQPITDVRLMREIVSRALRKAASSDCFFARRSCWPPSESPWGWSGQWA
jgi:MacB-like periplasmic core domain